MKTIIYFIYSKNTIIEEIKKILTLPDMLK